jgi:hypothetical protein
MPPTLADGDDSTFLTTLCVSFAGASDTASDFAGAGRLV